MKRSYNFPWAAQLLPDGSVRFRVWAPRHARMHIEIDGKELLPMLAFDGGWHELITYSAKVGSRYQFVLPNGLRVPDPASRYQAADVHGASEVINPEGYDWYDEWIGRDWHTAVIYELHIGAFTPEGTFLAAIDKLPHLALLGVTAVELMPVADFPGARNWGYDGTLLFAPDSSYGRPEDLKRFVAAAHAQGLMVILDVVYNHFGPDGNYLAEYAPQFFSQRHHTPWGAAINFDGELSRPVREFFMHNALYWLKEFHLDGLRLDAVHAIMDDSDKHILTELAQRVRTTITNRKIHLLLENEENQSRYLTPVGSESAYTAQWNDDIHHVLHTAVTHETAGYYRDYQGSTESLARALAEGFVFQGEHMAFRSSARGEASAHLPPTAFVSFIQNHDQIGNRALGERISALASETKVRAIAAIYLLAPQIPMLFMGEEWGALNPFCFFCDFNKHLGKAIAAGREQEFARMQTPTDAAALLNPQADTSFALAKLNWADLDQATHARILAWYRHVLSTRKREIVPLLPVIQSGGTYVMLADGAVSVSWQAGAAKLILVANLSEVAIEYSLPPAKVIWREGEPSAASLGPWAVLYLLEAG